MIGGGRHWTDGPLAVVAGPWYLLLALPGAVALVLWALILGLSVSLIALVLGANEQLILAAGAAVFAVSLYSGPGGSRVRGPLRTFTDAASGSTVLWLVFLICFAALSTGIAVLAQAQGVTWTPADAPPSEPSSVQQLWGEAVERVRFW